MKHKPLWRSMLIWHIAYLLALYRFFAHHFGSAIYAPKFISLGFLRLGVERPQEVFGCRVRVKWLKHLSLTLMIFPSLPQVASQQAFTIFTFKKDERPDTFTYDGVFFHMCRSSLTFFPAARFCWGSTLACSHRHRRFDMFCQYHVKQQCQCNSSGCVQNKIINLCLFSDHLMDWRVLFLNKAFIIIHDVVIKSSHR